MKKFLCAAVCCSAVLLISGCQAGESRGSYREAGIEALNAGDYETAVNSFDQALGKSQWLVGKFDLDVLKYRAEAEYRLGDYSAAAHTYDVLIKVDKETGEYLYLRSMAKAGSGDSDGALEDYAKAGELEQQAGKSDKKETDPEAENAGASEPRKAALLAVGKALEGKGSYEEAENLYKQAEAEGMQDASLYNRLGLCRMRAEAYDEALALFGKGIQSGAEEELKALEFNQAVAYEYKGEFETALQLFEQYAADYGADEQAEREIAFLKTR